MIKINDVSVSYGNIEALSEICLDVEKGAFLSVMGRNGVGKTTLMKTILGLLKPTKGSIQYKGLDVTKLPAYKRAKMGIGYVPQGRHIFPKLTVEENLFTGMDKQDNEILEEVYTYFPVLKEMKNRNGGDLSGGQQQQLAIGRALVTKPDLLILDEPTEGIQPNIITRIGEVLRVLSKEKGITIIIVEQYLDFIMEFSNSYAIINRGSIVSNGKTETLTKELIEEYLHV